MFEMFRRFKRFNEFNEFKRLGVENIQPLQLLASLFFKKKLRAFVSLCLRVSKKLLASVPRVSKPSCQNITQNNSSIYIHFLQAIFLFASTLHLIQPYLLQDRTSYIYIPNLIFLLPLLDLQLINPLQLV